MKHYAVTGNMGSGKSTVCRLFEVLGIPVYYSDSRAKLIMLEDKEVKQKLVDLLGKEVYHNSGELNREWMSRKIFSDPQLLEKVNGIVHPAVRKDYKKWRKSQQAPYTLQESALTFEIEAEKHVDGVIVVHAPIELLISRSMSRGNVSRESVQARLSKQLDQEIKKKRADYLVDNSLGVSLVKQVLKLHKNLSQNNNPAKSKKGN